jgi:hypothetical protein
MAKTASAFAPRRARVTNVVFIGCSTVGKDSTRLDRRAEVRSAPTPEHGTWGGGRQPSLRWRGRTVAGQVELGESALLVQCAPHITAGHE